MSALDVVTAVVNGAALLACVAAARLWWRHRSVPAAWLASTFLTIGVLVVLSVVFDESASDSLAVKILILLLMVSGYLLYRFADSIVPSPDGVQRVAGALVVVTVVATLAIREIPDAGSRAGVDPLGVAYLAVVMGAWATWCLGAGWLLMRASLGEPTVVRYRLRLLSAAAVGLGLVLPISMVVQEGNDAGQLAIEWFYALLGMLFIVGFAPPASLRASWRHPDEQRLYEAAVGFMSVTEPHEVAAILVPGVRRVLGADSVTLRSASGQVLAHDEREEPIPRRQVKEIHRELGDRVLDVSLSTTVPLFGDDEQGHLDRLSLLAELALDRLRLLDSERQARAQLERANAELESFVYTTSHDLKNPVLAVLGYLDVIREEHADELSEELRHHLDRVAVNSRHMEHLIRDLLELSRVGRIEVVAEAVDLESLVDDVTADLSAGHPSMQVVRGELPTVWMNPTRARQLVTNLLDNAARYGGRDDITVTLSAEDRDEGVRLVVADDGLGIPTVHLERVFGVFERLDAQAPGGTGMGLAICRRVVETVGGRMYAEPSDVGARIVIELPPQALAPIAVVGLVPESLEGSTP